MQIIPSPMNRIMPMLILFLAVLAGCQKEPPLPPTNTSQGILLNDNGTCEGAQVHGLWYNGVSSDTSYVLVNVMVTKAGPYHIITDNQDGVVFSGDGNFTDTGMQNVRLKPQGLFTKFGTIHFLTAYNYSPCSLSINIYDSTYRDQPDNTWQFTANGQIYKGTGTAVYTHWPTYAGDTYTFYGSMEGYSDTSLIVQSLYFDFENPDAPNHYSNVGESDFWFETTRFVSPRVGPWSPTPQTNPNPVTIMNVIKSNYSNIYQFRGTVSDPAGNVIQITDGRYRADHSTEINND